MLSQLRHEPDRQRTYLDTCRIHADSSRDSWSSNEVADSMPNSAEAGAHSFLT